MTIPQKLTGLIAATFTPMHPDGTLNLATIETLAAHCADTGLDGVFVAGTNGECHSLSVAERMRVTERWAEVLQGSRVKLVVHVGANCTSDAAELAEHARRAGAVAVAALAPSYFKPADVDALIDSLEPVAKAAAPLPFYYYDIPALTGVRLSAPEFLLKAVDRLPNLAGMKWTNPDLISLQFALRVADGRYEFLWGVDEMLMFGLSLGLRGAVGGTFPLAPALYRRLLEAMDRNDLDAAKVEQFRATSLLDVLGRHGYFSAVKAAMGMNGIEVGPARPPNGRLSAAALQALRSELERIGFFEWGGK